MLRSLSGDRLAQGELIQIPHGGDVVESRLRFEFKDGSLYDERVVFSQRHAFTLLSYSLVQKGLSFPEAIEATVDRATGRYHVRYRGDEDSPEETLSGIKAKSDRFLSHGDRIRRQQRQEPDKGA